MTETSVGADLLQPLEILAEFGLHLVSEHLRVLAVGDVALSVEEPGRDLVLRRVLDDRDDALEFFGGDFSGTVPAVPSAIFQAAFHCVQFVRRTAC